MPVDKVILAQRGRVGDVAGEEVGHFRCISRTRLCLLEITADLGRAAHARDLHAHAALLPGGAVELLHKKVHRRAGLFAVNVPEI